MPTRRTILQGAVATGANDAGGWSIRGWSATRRASGSGMETFLIASAKRRRLPAGLEKPAEPDLNSAPVGAGAVLIQ